MWAVRRAGRKKAPFNDEAFLCQLTRKIDRAGVFKPDLKRVMAAHGINNQQNVHQLLLENLIDADFETQEWMLQNVTTPYETSEKVSQAFYEKSMADLAADPGDEIISPG